jgi:hypothetical protein
MTIVVKLAAVVDEMEMAGNIFECYLNRKTGEFHTVAEGDGSVIDQERPGDQLPDWQREAIVKGREMLDSGEWVALPSSWDINAWSIMERFCRSVADPELSQLLKDRIRDRGAFRFFKDTIHRYGLADDWYRFRRQALEEIAIDWLEENKIPFARDK